MKHYADITVRDRLDQIVAVVEGKNRQNLSERDARDYLARLEAAWPGLLPQFVFVVSQDVGYLWRRSDQRWWDVNVRDSLSAWLSFDTSLPPSKNALERRLTGDAFDAALLLWLQSLASKEHAADGGERVLEFAGLIDALRGSSFRLESAA